MVQSQATHFNDKKTCRNQFRFGFLLDFDPSHDGNQFPWISRKKHFAGAASVAMRYHQQCWATRARKHRKWWQWSRGFGVQSRMAREIIKLTQCESSIVIPGLNGGKKSFRGKLILNVLFWNFMVAVVFKTKARCTIYINAFSLLTCCWAEVVKRPHVECCGSSIRPNALGVRKIRKSWCWFMQPRMGRAGGWGLTTDTESWLKCSASGSVLEICVYLWPFYLILLAKRHPFYRVIQHPFTCRQTSGSGWGSNRTSTICYSTSRNILRLKTSPIVFFILFKSQGLCIVLSMSFSSISSWSQWIQNFYFTNNTEQQSEWKHSQPLSTCATQSPSGRGPRSWRHGKRTAARGCAQCAPSTWAPLTHRGVQISGMVFLRLNFIELTRFHILSICIIMSIIALTDLLSWSLLTQLVCFMVVYVGLEVSTKNKSKVPGGSSTTDASAGAQWWLPFQAGLASDFDEFRERTDLLRKVYNLRFFMRFSVFISLRLMPPAFAGLEIASSMARSTTKSSSSNNSTILSIASSMARSTTKSNSNSSNNQQQQ